MHAKPDLRVFLKWMIAGSGSVITDVIQTNSSMHICLDIDDTITYEPIFFAMLTQAFTTAKITIVTFRTDFDAAMHLLNELGIRYDKLVVSTDDAEGQTDGESLHVWKSRLINRLKPDIFFEDMPEVVALIDDGIAVFQPCDKLIRSWMREQLAKS